MPGNPELVRTTVETRGGWETWLVRSPGVERSQRRALGAGGWRWSVRRDATCTVASGRRTSSRSARKPNARQRHASGASDPSRCEVTSMADINDSGQRRRRTVRHGHGRPAQHGWTGGQTELLMRWSHLPATPDVPTQPEATARTFKWLSLRRRTGTRWPACRGPDTQHAAWQPCTTSALGQALFAADQRRTGVRRPTARNLGPLRVNHMRQHLAKRTAHGGPGL